MKRFQITNDTFKGDAKLMSDLVEFLSDIESIDANGLKKTSEFLTVAFASSNRELVQKVDECCKVQLVDNNDYMRSKTLNFWCFSPALG